MVVVAVLAATAFVAACSSTPKSEAPKVVDLQQSLDQATAAQERGDIAKALTLLNEAARAHPGSKLPWLRSAQVHFDTMNYGAAIVAAQEVLQRDTTDITARSILAVSGLRVSAAALAQLRQANSVSGSTRTEAEGLARTIRDALGEPILVPPPAASGGHARGNASGDRSSATNGSTSSTTNTTRTRRAERPASPPPAAASPSVSTGGRNPFEALQ
jgi:hypothetical protein